MPIANLNPQDHAARVGTAAEMSAALRANGLHEEADSLERAASRGHVARELAAALRARGHHSTAAAFERTAATGQLPATGDQAAARGIAEQLAAQLRAVGTNIYPHLLLTFDADDIGSMVHRVRTAAAEQTATAARDAEDDVELRRYLEDAASATRVADLWSQLGAALHGPGWDAPAPTKQLEAARAAAGLPPGPAGRAASQAYRPRAAGVDDLGDQIVALIDGAERPAGDYQQGATHAPNRAYGAVGDVGDQIVALIESEGQEGGRRLATPPATTSASRATGDVGDQVVALIDAEKKAAS
jgi:hypothetical protein